LVSILSIFWWQGFNLGIDFKGGVLIEVRAAQVIDVGKMRSDIITLGYGDPVVQTFSGTGECDKPKGSCAMIRVLPPQVKAGQDQSKMEQQVVSSIKAKLGPAFSFRRTEMVG